jgi:hypothetical protein
MEREAGRMGFTQEFGNDPRFVPALYKIGLNLVATAQQRPPIRVTTIFAHLCEASLPRQNFELRWIADRALDRLLLRLIQL